MRLTEVATTFQDQLLEKALTNNAKPLLEDTTDTTLVAPQDAEVVIARLFE